MLTGCAGSSTPAPVTTLEIRKQQHQLRQQQTLSGRSYQVQRGDTLYSIAFRAGQDFRTVAARNNIKAPYTIYPGQIIQLQAGTAAKIKGSVTPTTSKSSTVKSVAASSQKGYVQERSPVNITQSASTAVGRVSWQWPVKGPILARFSTAEQGNKGVDIGGSAGSRINAAADGQVVYAGNALRGYGNLIIIKHNDDYLSAYAHNKRLLVKERQDVKAGQQIAEMGDTDAVDTRLHFEIRFRGQSVDPLRYLPR
ncbi:peptidoglycan DD-metalloendopeptidase family protein [Alishewanella sp. 16-MA]|uniref:Peptidoglycan DD-metalloendopeptidase family protein n=1 Tax=Alishewanella maricola TaxID=2795740 RepID=A0ABS8C028_9ALTE|nr:peptidoglycan DD-metalloendopeptidase family protein [Alishewanella maricola]MCB5225538.1 peptidoglycan DD-metalloendopeptidase family protein [Alishewanella maricola]